MLAKHLLNAIFTEAVFDITLVEARFQILSAAVLGSTTRLHCPVAADCTQFIYGVEIFVAGDRVPLNGGIIIFHGEDIGAGPNFYLF